MADESDYGDDISEWDDDSEDAGTTTTTYEDTADGGGGEGRRLRNPRLSQQEKLDRVVHTIRDVRWTFSDFMLAWAGADGSDTRVAHRRYHKVAARRRHLCQVVRTLATRGIVHNELGYIRTCERELSELVRHPSFGKYSHQDHINMDNLNYSDAIRAIKETAPTWHNLLQDLLSNARTRWGSYRYKPALGKRIFAITSIVCFTRSQQTSNMLASCLDIYLQGSGVHRRVIQTLSGLGLCHTYATGNQLMKTLETFAAVS